MPRSEGDHRLAVRARLDHLVQTAAAQLAQNPSTIAQHLSATLRSVKTTVMSLEPRMPPASTLIEADADSGSALAAALAPCLHDLHWKAPGFGRLPTTVSDHMTVAELIGPNGTFHSDAIRFGFLWQGATLHYPSHSHAAEELYLILQGGAEWQIDHGDWRQKTAGAFIHHPAGCPHAIRTGPRAVLTAWGWSGDIGSASYAL